MTDQEANLATDPGEVAPLAEPHILALTVGDFAMVERPVLEPGDGEDVAQGDRPSSG